MTAADSSSGNDQKYFALEKSIAIMLAVIPCFYGSSVGLRECVVGVCQASEISLELSLTILPFAFTSAPSIYALIFFFLFSRETISDHTAWIKLCMADSLMGSGGYLSGYAVGGICRHAFVIRANQKKFQTQFLVMLVFAELIGIFAFIITFIGKDMR